MTPFLAHLGGLDEIGVYVVPILLGLYALRWAEKRARQREAAEENSDDPQGSSDQDQTQELDAGAAGPEA
jgi:hypothetical protein